MEVLISSCGRFHSHQAAFESYKRDALKLYFTTYNERRLPSDKIRRVPLIDNIHRALRRIKFIRDAIPLDLAKKRLFDRLAQRYVDDCDLLYTHSTLQIETIRRAQSLRIPAVVDRGTAHPVHQNQVLGEERARFAPDLPPIFCPGEIERHLVEFDTADCVIVNSSYVRDTFIANGFDAEKLIILSQGVDLSLFRSVGKQDNVFRVLTVGLLSLQKGTHYLLKAFHELGFPNSELMLVGRPRPDIVPILARYEGTFTHIPGVPHEQLYHTYSNASVFALVSINDGFASVVIEAMACGVPVIVSENVGARDIIREGIDGFVIPIRDVEAMKDRLTKLYENPCLCKQMGQAARLRAQEFSSDRYGDRLLEVYQHILSKSTTGPQASTSSVRF